MMLEMQDVQYSMGGGGGAGAGGGDRRMRPQHFQINHQSLQALKCPRCDSVNTKFCYFNNYNLSQPRHFCKGCRRYWTRGGVLRNVPVGGGCRKAKRSNPKPQSETSAAVRTVRERKAANSHSSSESSSLTATTPAVATAAAATKAVTASLSRSAPVLITGENPSFEVVGLMEQQPPSCGIFPESGSFTNLLSSINDASPFEFNNNSSSNISDLTTSFGYQFQGQDNNRWQPQKMAGVGVVEELRKQEITAVGMLDQAVQIDLSTFHNSRSSNVGFGSLDWHVNGDQVLCDLPNTADQAYWVQSQWTTTDHQDHHPNLFLP